VDAKNEQNGPLEAASLERLRLLKVPLDVVGAEQLEELVYRLLQFGERNIVLLSLWDLLRARRNGEYRSYVEQATLVLPIAKSLVSGTRFLLQKKVFRYMPFDFVIQLLGILEKRGFSVYLLGGKMRVLKKAEKNIRQTFPRLRVVGRFVGNFKHQDGPAILKAIRKAAPSLLLVGRGVHGGERWIARNSTALGPGLRLWCSDLFDIFAERRKRPSRAVFDRGLEWAGFCFQQPWRFFRLFYYLYYKILLCAYRLFDIE
jgi:N-acetylglucosaminyldiphosphoundecaprenol N-acetyl-beta-D-mannosaminyltransferase